jgi:hypothetical protein
MKVFRAPGAPGAMRNTCVFSQCRQYRYTLDHDESELRSSSRDYVAWIGLNPSVADEQKLDPTLRRILAFTDRLGFQRFLMLNLFALVSTDPGAMRTHANPVGPLNDETIFNACAGASLVVCCWGFNGNHRGRAQSVLELLSPRKLHCLGQTVMGHPRHPLYLSGNTPLCPLSQF